MPDTLLIIAAMAYSYLAGSIPTAYLIGRLVKGIDIREYGSGNVGGSNVARHVGRGYFVFVAAFDILFKGTLTILLVRWLELGLAYQAWAAVLATAGHNWSVFLRFTGGRGLAVTLGSMAILVWMEAALALTIALIGIAVFRSSAIWFGIGLVLLPFLALAFGEPYTIVLLCFAMLLIAVLKRLLSNQLTPASGLRWRDVLLARLLYDRDVARGDDWVDRTPADSTTEIAS
jgi:glycerol-3-phosphate acyltransferase PlsY